MFYPLYPWFHFVTSHNNSRHSLYYHADYNNPIFHCFQNVLLIVTVIVLLIKRTNCTSKPIIATIDAKWPSTPILLESRFVGNK